MSQYKKLELSERVREFRVRAKLSQEELGELMGVSGNYVSMIELGKKSPGSTLRKLFDIFEQSLQYQTPAQTSAAGPGESFPGTAGAGPTNSLILLMATETLVLTFADVAKQLLQPDSAKQRWVLGNLRELLGEIERRLLPSSGPLSEVQRSAIQAAKSAGSPGTK
jgi:transcriptional regulator with XRE-family HTH domain